MNNGEVKINFHLEDPKHKISRHIYGHFAEHLGSCIYGGFYVGSDSSIPNDKGLRLDVIDALRKLSVPSLRWPGGCFADTYHWRDGIGRAKQRPAIVNTWWGGVTEDNSFGTHEFLYLCELLGAEPFIAANVGSGTVKELMDWVQYVNFDGVSPMSNLRKENGREQPWQVRYWGLGNEAWGCGGNMRAEYYADYYRQYATFMTDWSNSTGLFRIACGAQSDDYHWTEVLMRDIPHKLMEGVGLHHYAVIDWNNKGSSIHFSEEQYSNTLEKALLMEELVTRHGAIMDRYDPQKKIALVVDEWGGWYDPEPGTNPGFLYQQNTMRDAMIAAVTLNIFNAHADRVRMANLAQAVNVLQAVLLVNGEKVIFTPTYHVMHMFRKHQEGWYIPVEFNSPLYISKEKRLPAISVSASLSEGGSVLITVANIDTKKAYELVLPQHLSHASLSASILTSHSVHSCNTFEEPDLICPRAHPVSLTSGAGIGVQLPPVSVVAINITF